MCPCFCNQHGHFWRSQCSTMAATPRPSLKPVSKTCLLFIAFVLLTTSSITFVWTQNTDPVEDVFNTLTGWRDLIISKVSSKLDEIKITDFDTIGKILDATIEEDCELPSCPSGFVKEVNPNHNPNSNGCGSFGIQWKRELLPAEGQEDCCNDHDFCYDECGADKDLCDFKFKKCLYRVCKEAQASLDTTQLKACKAAAKLMYTGTQALGCKAYLDAQELACRCVPIIKEEL